VRIASKYLVEPHKKTGIKPSRRKLAPVQARGPGKRAYRLLPELTIGGLAVLGCAFVAALAMPLDLMNRSYLLIIPLIGAISAYGLLKDAKQQDDLAHFRSSVLIVMAAFATLACLFWPFMIPFARAVEQAASPPVSPAFMLWGAGLFVIPFTLVYTTAVYRLSREKVAEVHDE